MKVIKNSKKNLLLILNFVIFLVFPTFVFAGNVPLEKLQGVAEKGGYAAGVDEFSMSEMVGSIIMAFLSLLGVIFVVLLIYGGFKWMKASGREEDVKTAQAVIQQAIIGLIITTSAWAIMNFVLGSILNN